MDREGQSEVGFVLHIKLLFVDVRKALHFLLFVFHLTACIICIGGLTI